MYRYWLMFRSALFWFWQIAVTLLMGAPVIIGGLISFRIGYAFAIIWNRLNLYGLRWICGIKWQVDGRENIPDKPCIVMSKHQSTWETYFLPTLFYPAVYVAKKSLLWIPIFGWALYVLRFIMIDRSSGRSAIQQICEQAPVRLSQGRWIVVFPEGTRRPVGSEANYRIGGAVVANELGCDVVPIALNAGEYWPRMGFIKWPGVITVSIGPLITSEDKSPAQILAETEHWIEARVAELSGSNPALQGQ
ncbi:MAG: 1-acyl-sn-glycerol-3-phosphate acyltransferase [Granulosicoccus sp.]|nr:1-acyl-sn-glycerol-3-phosphate acyltransferase [Granulosicoccus sp.]